MGLLIFVVALSVLWLLTGFIMFVVIFHRNDDLKPLNTVDLTGTPYEPYKEKICRLMSKAENLNFEERFLITEDQKMMFGLYLDKGSHKTVVFTSGYQASPFSNFSYQVQLFLREGYNIFLIFPRGHGPSEGAFTSFGIQESRDLLEWLNRVVLKEPNVEEVVLYGTSMGGFATALAAPHITDERVKAMVVDCAFDSLEEMLSYQYRKRYFYYPMFMPVLALWYRLIFGFGYRRVSASKALQESKIPAFFIHGTDDSVIPFENGVQNAENCASEHETCWVECAEHTIALLQDEPRSTEKMFAFIHQYVSHNHSGEV